MWTQVSASDEAGLRRHVAIMQQMDHGYGTLTVYDLMERILRLQGEVWHYQGNGFEIGLIFQYRSQRSQWELAQVGFIGQVQPSVVLDLSTQRFKDFLQGHGISSVTAVRPTAVDYQPLEALYELVPQSPKLKLTVGQPVALGTVWTIAYVGP
jgi:hypothetical protein